MSYGIKISESGTGVLSATNAQTIFSSELQTLKTLSTLKANTTTYNRTVSEFEHYYDFSHNLGYLPTFLEYDKYGTVWSQPMFGGTNTTTTYSFYWDKLTGDGTGPAELSVFFFIRPFDTTAGSTITTSSHGVFSSKTGANVGPVPITDITFNSDYEHWMIVDTMSFSLTYTATAGTQDSTKQAHGLGYTPAFMGFGTRASGADYTVYPFFDTDDVNINGFKICADSTDIWLRVEQTDWFEDGSFLTSGTATAKVLVFNAALE